MAVLVLNLCDCDNFYYSLGSHGFAGVHSGHIPSPSGAAKEDNVKERENSEVKQFFGWAELRIRVTDNGRTGRRGS